MKSIDTHAHVFTDSCRFVENRRYTPAYEAPLSAYLAELDAAAVPHAVLVQPSFLGTDNGYLVDALKATHGRLKGIAVVDPEVSEAELDELSDANVIGMRLNLVGLDPAMVAEPRWQHLCRRVGARGWLIEVQVDGRHLADVLEALSGVGAPLVIDHFGRPEARLGLDDPGFRALLERAPDGGIWVKLSAPYRCGDVDMRPYSEALLQAFGPKRLLWGSDWPWTQFEVGRSYRQTEDWLEEWVPDPAARRTIEAETPSQLFGFH